MIRWLVGCPHPSMYRERRPLHGVPVMHLVCDRCGHAQPVMRRTAEEHRDMARVRPGETATKLGPAETRLRKVK